MTPVVTSAATAQRLWGEAAAHVFALRKSWMCSDTGRCTLAGVLGAVPSDAVPPVAVS